MKVLGSPPNRQRHAARTRRAVAAAAPPRAAAGTSVSVNRLSDPPDADPGPGRPCTLPTPQYTPGALLRSTRWACARRGPASLAPSPTPDPA